MANRIFSASCALLAMALILWGCVANTGKMVQTAFNPKMTFADKPSVRSKPAEIFEKDAAGALTTDRGYLELGQVSVSQKKKLCWAFDDCKDYQHTKSALELLQLEAASVGGDAVLITHRHETTETATKRGKCAEMGEGQVAKWVCDTESYTNAMGNYDTRQVNCRNEYVTGRVCVRYESKSGTIYYTGITGKVYRHDPALARSVGAMQAYKAALLDGSEPEVKKHIDAGQPVREALPDGTLPLLFAAYNNNATAVRVLASAGAPPVNEALKYGIERGHHDVVRALIEAGADVNAFKETSKPPILLAIDNNDRKMVQILVVGGADLEAMEPVRKGSHAHVYGDGGVKVIAALEEKMPALLAGMLADGTIKPSQVTSPFFLVIASGSTAAVQHWIKQGADLDARNKEGQTPLMLCIGPKKQAMARELITAGADLNAVDNNGQSVLHYALDRNPDLAHEMLATGKITTTVDISLLHAAYGGSDRELVLNLMARIPGRDKGYHDHAYKRSLFRKAAAGGDMATLDLLIAKGGVDLYLNYFYKPAREDALKAGREKVATYLDRKREASRNSLLNTRPESTQKRSNSYYPYTAEMIKRYKLDEEPDVEAFKQLLAQHEKYPVPPIIVATRYGGLKMVRALLESGVDINTEFGLDNAFYPAALTRDYEMMHLLLTWREPMAPKYISKGLANLAETPYTGLLLRALELGADPNYKNTYGTPLRNATSKQQYDNMMLLMDYGGR